MNEKSLDKLKKSYQENTKQLYFEHAGNDGIERYTEDFVNYCAEKAVEWHTKFSTIYNELKNIKEKLNKE